MNRRFQDDFKIVATATVSKERQFFNHLAQALTHLAYFEAVKYSHQENNLKRNMAIVRHALKLTDLGRKILWDYDRMLAAAQNPLLKDKEYLSIALDISSHYPDEIELTWEGEGSE